jgi:hypothetical protein
LVVGFVDLAEVFLRDLLEPGIRLKAVGVPNADEVLVSLSDLFRCRIGWNTENPLTEAYVHIWGWSNRQAANAEPIFHTEDHIPQRQRQVPSDLFIHDLKFAASLGRRAFRGDGTVSTPS